MSVTTREAGRPPRQQLPIPPGALAARQWTDRDAQALRPLLGRLVERDHDEVVLALVRAINEGRLAVTTGGPPF